VDRYLRANPVPATRLRPVCMAIMENLVPAFVGHLDSSNSGGLPRYPIKFVLPLGFALLCLQGLSELIKRVAALRGKLQLDTHYERLEQ